MAEIIVDHENLTIKIGEKVCYSSPVFFSNPSHFAENVRTQITEKWLSPKERNKLVSEYLGCTPKAFLPVLKAKMCELWIKPLPRDVLNAIPYSGFHKSYYPAFISKCRQKINLIQTLQNDNMLSITPFIINNIYPNAKEMRKNVGKGLWKKLLDNSLAHNFNIAWHFGTALNISSSFAKNAQFTTKFMFNLSEIETLDKTARKYKFLTKRKILNDFINIVADTQKMALDNNYHFDIRWSPKRMKEEHDNMVKMINQRKYSKDKISWLVKYPKELTLGDCSARLLESPYDFSVEGNEMGHCVVVYSQSCIQGNYLVYHIESENEQSTVGFNCLNGNIESIDQHYGKYNARITDENHRIMVEYILFKLKNLDCRLETVDIA